MGPQQPRKATPSELWASIPNSKSDLLPQMKRDYQALSLANSLDPKRFMKGGSKAGKVPEVFAVDLTLNSSRAETDFGCRLDNCWSRHDTCRVLPPSVRLVIVQGI